MAFGFFKKNEAADIIFMGGRIFTQNSDFPWVEAVACKDGLILGVGDYEDLTEFEGKNTEIVDLEGGVMLPGYIDVCGHPALDAFKDSCLFLTDGGLEDILAQISGYAAANDDAGVIFAYGYNERILEGVEAEQARAFLDGVSEDKPVIALGKSGSSCFFNTAAVDIIRAAAEADEVKAVTLNYLLSVLEPIDLNTMPEAVITAMGEYCRRGFTTVFDCGAPDFFASVYQNFMVHLYEEEMLKQRFYGSLLITRDVNPDSVMRRLSQLRTNCAELNGYINFKTLKLIVEDTGEALSVSGEVLKELCLEAGDKGFDVHIDARGEAAMEKAVEAMEATRSAGYRKNSFTLIHGPEADSRELADTCYQLGITEIVRKNPGGAGPSGTAGETGAAGMAEAPDVADVPGNRWLCIEGAGSGEEAVDMLTVNAAEQLGISGDYGSIEKGKHADFVIFDDDPFEAKSLEEFKKLKAVMTVIGGDIVYDAEEDDPAAWYSILSQQQSEQLE